MRHIGQLQRSFTDALLVHHAVINRRFKMFPSPLTPDALVYIPGSGEAVASCFLWSVPFFGVHNSIGIACSDTTTILRTLAEGVWKGALHRGGMLVFVSVLAGPVDEPISFSVARQAHRLLQNALLFRGLEGAESWAIELDYKRWPTLFTHTSTSPTYPQH